VEHPKGAKTHNATQHPKVAQAMSHTDIAMYRSFDF
jgi:hypothetical protein